jgi:RNase H-like domain found in reverse transcriptase/Reverse transcriptase (RNA-dependent DNA polymerase)/Integrase zinc binding domain/Integrase core domain/SCAN domain
MATSVDKPSVSVTSKTLSIPDILHMTVEQLKSELTSRGIVQLTGLTKPDLQAELCKFVPIDVTPSKLQGMVTLTTLDKRSPTNSNYSSNDSSPVHEKTATKKVPEPNLTSEQMFELEKMRIQMEIRKDEILMRKDEIQMRKNELEREAVQKEREFELHKLQVEHQHALELAKVTSVASAPVHHTAVSSEGTVGANKYRIDVLTKMVPRFDPNDVDLFFTSFERTLLLNKIPDEQWPVVLNAIVFGKAQRVLSSLSLDELHDYELVKGTLLSAFEVCADVFRKRFRTVSKGYNDSFAEFSFKIKESFDRWLFKSNVTDFESLQQLMLLERFNQSFSEDSELSMWMLNKSPTKLSEAALLADEFTAMRRANKGNFKRSNYAPQTRSNYSNQNQSKENQKDSQTPVMQNSFDKPDKPFKTNVFKASSAFKAPPAATIKCAYCKKPGHNISECYALKRKKQNESTTQENATNSNSADHCLVATSHEKVEFQNILRDTVDHRYRPHCFEITIIRPDKTEFCVTCLRDTAALQSLIRDFNMVSNFESPKKSSYIITHESRQICGIGGTRIAVPLVQVDIRSEQVTGLFDFGVCNNLPHGIDILAGNDLFNDGNTDVYVITRSQTATERSASVIPHTVLPQIDTDVDSSVLDQKVMISNNESVETVPSISENDNSDLNLSLLFENTEATKISISSVVDRDSLIKLQQSDSSLKRYSDQARQLPHDVNRVERFFFKSGVLMRNWHHRSQPTDTGHNQIVAPAAIRHQLLYISHDIPASGHLGVRKSLDRLIRHFWWGTIQSDVREYIRTCHQCQCLGKGSKKIIAPLHSMPVVTEPWSICAIDIVGPLPVCKETGNRFILTILDLCTHYPEAIALKQHTARDVALALANVFSRVGFPEQILSDLGTEFTSEIMQIFLHEFNIGHLRCSAYHPMNNGAVEKYNGCLKSSLKALTERFPDAWDATLCWVLFGYREVVNETTGFSPFELLYGRSVKGPLTLIKDAMLNETDLSHSKKSVVEFMLEIRERLRSSLELATIHAREQRTKAKVWYDRKARLQVFKPGDKVLMLLPIPGSPLELKLHGPYVIVEKLGPVDYVISTPERRKTRRICHVNLLRPYRQRDLTTYPDLPGFAATVNVVYDENDVTLPSINGNITKLSSKNLEQLTPQQQSELVSIFSEFDGVFSDKPGRTTLCEHHIELMPGAKPVFCRPYRMSPDKAKILKDEVTSLLEQGIVEEAPSNGNTWASPVLLVAKADGSWRLCTDMRIVNSRTEVDPFPLPRIEELIDRVGSAKYLTKLDMVRGYWQVPLDNASIPISGFVTPFGHFRWRYMHFGCRNAPATFSRLVLKLFSGLEMFCAAFLDDILIFSDNWEDHKRHLAEVLRRIKNAGLTLNLSKSVFAVAELDFLGYHIGCNRVQPREKKIAALLQYNRPIDRKTLQQFLGLAGYYRKFLPNFSHMSAVLSSLLRKNAEFKWTEEAEKAFVDLKSRLSSRPILRPPNFAQEFCMAVDASNIAVGGHLFQVIDGIEHPICYWSKKLDVHQQRYSTVEKEALGLILAVRAFSVYFGSTKVTVYTDHNPLVFLQKMCNHNQKLLRWCLELQQYNLNIHHRPGKDNIIPDLLSRSM